MPAPKIPFDEEPACRQRRMRPAAVLAEQQRAPALLSPRPEVRPAAPDLARVGSRWAAVVVKRAEEPPAIWLVVAKDAMAPAAGVGIGALVQARRQSASWNWLPLVVVQDGLGAQLGLAARLAVARVAEAVGWPEPHAQGRVGLAAALLVVAEPVQGVAGWAAQHFVAQLVAVQVQQVSVRQRTRHEQCPAHAECAAHP